MPSRAIPSLVKLDLKKVFTAHLFLTESIQGEMLNATILKAFAKS